MTIAEVLVFTDLDGTLLDDDYDLQAAAATINELQKKSVAVVPVSSKTLPELAALAAYIEVPTPWVFENGAGIAWSDDVVPPGTFPRDHGRAIEVTGPGYPAICKKLESLRRRYRFDFIGFADMSPTDIATVTGLTLTAAELATQRLASEPLLWRGSQAQLAQFEAQLAKASLQIVQGGRFHHVMPMTDKGSAANRVRRLYQYTLGRPHLTVACGDSPNDLPLFHVADVCVVCPGRNGDYLDVSNTPAIQADAAGPEDWDTAVNQALSQCATH